ncbi:MAG: alpha/beta fold hydrolase [Bradymonadaceae bacterium]
MKSPLKFTVAGDGTSLAYQTRGSGQPIVFTNGFATSTFYWQPLLERLQPHARLVTWDLKGHGRSAPARRPELFDVPSCADDLRRVLDATGIEKATLVGFSFGCQIVLEAWRHFPDRIEAIVPILGPVGRPFDSLIHPKVGRTLFDIFRLGGTRGARLMLETGRQAVKLRGTHEIAQQLGFICPNVTVAQMQPFYDHLGLIDAVSWHALGAAAQNHTAEDLLESIECPVLVISGGKDAFAPARLSRLMAERIPNAHHLHLETATHTGLFGQADLIGEAVEGFLNDHVGMTFSSLNGRP